MTVWIGNKKRNIIKKCSRITTNSYENAWLNEAGDALTKRKPKLIHKIFLSLNFSDSLFVFLALGSAKGKLQIYSNQMLNTSTRINSYIQATQRLIKVFRNNIDDCQRPYTNTWRLWMKADLCQTHHINQANHNRNNIIIFMISLISHEY